MASDGRYIYGLSTEIKQGEENAPPTIEKVYVEVYEIEETTCNVKFVRKVLLKRDEETPFVYRIKNYTGDGGYLNHLQSACNGRIFVLNSPHRTYFFNTETGVRLTRTSKRSS